jgi:dGTPase
LRSLASVLKYDKQIPVKRKSDAPSARKPVKGYYHTEHALVQSLKRHVAPHSSGAFRTIECSIMDVADDIAYSTYDIEDSFKAGFLSPAKLLSASDTIKRRVAKNVSSRLRTIYGVRPSEEMRYSIDDMIAKMIEMFGPLLEVPSVEFERKIGNSIVLNYAIGTSIFTASDEMTTNGYLRTSFTAGLVGQFIRNVELKKSNELSLSTARLDVETFKLVETLKEFAFDSLIDSPRLKLAEQRGFEIIEKIFKSLVENPSLLPEDWGEIFEGSRNDIDRRRVVCDYVAGMTDRYCVEMYARLTGTDPVTIYKPH